MSGGEGERDRSERDVSNVVTGNSQAHVVVQAGRIDVLNLPGLAVRSWIPLQMPPAPGPFLNRRSELAQLQAVLDGGQHENGVTTVHVTGLGGSGKTSLLGYWAGQLHLAGHSPDGQLHADLSLRRRDGAVDTHAVLGGFLRALGVPQARIPDDLIDRQQLYRSATAQLRVLVCVEGAATAAEVEPLRPARGLFVVASRARLPWLVPEARGCVTVGPLPERSGTRLLREWLGGAAGADDDALAELWRLCAGVPLAMRVVAAQLGDGAGPSVGAGIARINARLRDERQRLGVLSGEDLHDGEVPSVTHGLDTVFDHELAEPARRLYLLLGTHPGSTFTRGLLAHCSAPAGALTELLRRHMAIPLAGGHGDGGDRFQLHDLVRDHARDRARRLLSEEERARLLHPVTEYYRDGVVAADRRSGDRYRLPGTGIPATPALEFPDREAAAAWLDAEQDNLLPVLRAAADTGWHGTVWETCEALWWYVHNRKPYALWISAYQLGVESAQLEARADAEVRLRNGLARAHYELGDHEPARQQLSRARQRLEGMNEPDPRLTGVVWETSGLLDLARGLPGEARAYFQRALDANVEARDPHGIAVQSYNIAQAHLAAGDHGAAETALRRAARIVDERQDTPMRARIGVVRARARLAAGDPEGAAAYAAEAAEWATHQGQLPKLEQALTVLAEAAGRIPDATLERAARRKLRGLHERLGKER